MAETESNVNGDAKLTTDDDLSETNIGAVLARSNAIDYVERGCGFSVNHTNDTITIGSTGTRNNAVLVEEPSGHVGRVLFPDQATDIALPNASATCHVYIAYNTSTDQIFYHIDDDDTAPSEPSLKIGTVDTANDTSTETNRAPTITADDLDIGTGDFVATGDEVYLGPSKSPSDTFSTSSSTYTTFTKSWLVVNLANDIPADAQLRIRISGEFDNGGDQLDVKIRERNIDGADVLEETNVGSNGGSAARFAENYTPASAVDNTFVFELRIKNSNNSTTVSVSQYQINLGVQV